MSSMKLLCPNCGRRSELGSAVCIACGGELTYAAEVKDDSDVPGQQPEIGSGQQEVPAASTISGDEVICTCAFPEGDIGEIHFACGGRIAALPPRASRHSAHAERAPGSPGSVAGGARLLLPGGVYVPVGYGCLLGRGVDDNVTGIAALLRPYPGVSRRHAWIGDVEGNLTLIDLDSHNGTWIGDTRLQAWRAQVLPANEQHIDIRLGGALLISVERGTKA